MTGIEEARTFLPLISRKATMALASLGRYEEAKEFAYEAERRLEAGGAKMAARAAGFVLLGR